MAANYFNSHLGLALAYLIFLISIPKSLSVLEPQPSPPSVWDILPKFGLPSGLLPSTVTDYVLHDDGRFIVMLDSPCYIQFEYLVYYEKTITGKLGYGSITDLEGIQVQRFFLWFDVNEIKVDLPPSDSIYFQVGFINKKLDVDQFKTIHSCRDEVTGSCKYSSESLLQLPMPRNEIEELITESKAVESASSLHKSGGADLDLYLWVLHAKVRFKIFHAMFYKNKFVLSGKVNDIRLYLRIYG
ncbi:hypothetical protein CXB51_018851 [Gossypium anomalum]|uniref:Uncharacterized protein n=1 Tax=Gossypium anomalum TaxID=47600 RepID=A0A8J6CXA2_9ROSI|nr:hypothetical protein CXB51_018851 [Gossypium anomalum]